MPYNEDAYVGDRDKRSHGNETPNPHNSNSSPPKQDNSPRPHDDAGNGGGNGNVGGGGSGDMPPSDNSGDHDGHEEHKQESRQKRGKRENKGKEKDQPARPKGLQIDPVLGDRRDRQRIEGEPGTERRARPLGYTMADVRARAKGNDIAREAILLVDTEEKPASTGLHRIMQAMSSYNRRPELRTEAHSIVDMLLGLPKRAKPTRQSYTVQTEFLRATPTSNPSSDVDALQQTVELAKKAMPGKFDNLEINQALQFGTPNYYGYIMEAVFGYKIEFSSDLSDTQRVSALRELAGSSLILIGYLNLIAYHNTSDQTGLNIFRRVFSENGKITVYIGAEVGSNWDLANSAIVKRAAWDEKTPVDAFSAITPAADNPSSYSGIFLGSLMTEEPITHEFFHQMGRYFGVTASSDEFFDDLGAFLKTVPNRYNHNNTGEYTNQSLANVLTGRAANDKGADYGEIGEIFPDFGMTDAIAAYGGQYGGIYNAKSNDTEPIGWRTTTSGEMTENAKDLKCAFRQFLLYRLAGHSGIPTFSRDLCED